MNGLKSVVSRRPVASFVALTYAISWSIWLRLSQATSDPSFIMVLPGAFGPAIAVAIVVSLTGGSLRTWVREMATWRVAPRWYLAALGLPILFAGAETVAYAAFVGPLEPSVLPRRVVFWFATFLFAVTVGGGIEEPGWRGFMQPRLQRSYSAVSAAVLVGLVWTVWHLPLHVFLPSLGGGLVEGVFSRIATVPLAIVYAWLYNETEGSVLIAMLLHGGWNSAQTLVPATGTVGAESATYTITVLWSARLAVLLVVVGLLQFVYNTDSLASTDRHTPTKYDITKPPE
jgi:membrane protease YdiL (CAAX protease family)